jgi:microsomal dipeptidase-like Zn-dependent dipeptidase
VSQVFRTVQNAGSVIADLHAHYPMHLIPEAEGNPYDLFAKAAGRDRWRDHVRAWLVNFAGRFGNYRDFWSGPRVTIPSLRQGGVGVALSVLYQFFDELDIEEHYGAPPKANYLQDLLGQLEEVEKDIRDKHAADAVVAHSPAELQVAIDGDKLALVHCVEGGFHLGATPEGVDAGVTELARRGVAYIVLPHLVYRGVATSAPALPFMPDWLYKVVFSQPREGLSPLGRAAVEAMIREHVLIDLSHMSNQAVSETLDLLDELDPGREAPVIASHGCFRFKGQEYGLPTETLKRVAARDGVVGLLLAQHQLLHGDRRGKTETFEDSKEVFFRHIDSIHGATGSHRHTAIGSDLDGFIKPTLSGIESASDMTKLEQALREEYGADADLICSENALRPLRGWWRGAA